MKNMKFKFNLRDEKHRKSVYQILILMIGIFAFAYIIHEGNKVLESVSKNDEIKNTLALESSNSALLSLLDTIKKNLDTEKTYSFRGVQETRHFFDFGLKFLDILPSVSAQTSNYPAGQGGNVQASCCLENRQGAKCAEYPSSAIGDICDANKIVPQACNLVSTCQLGCCIDPIEGSCTPNSPKGLCESPGGTWKNDINCNLQDCKKGCCVLGSKVEFTTETMCAKQAALSGLEKDFKQAQNELQCWAYAQTTEVGACVFSDGSCKIATTQECSALQGDGFKPGLLCSNPDLNTTCEKQVSVGCVEEKDEIYWFDSCGNRENIYNSNKDQSWNDGKILGKNESCNSNLDNSNSQTCGNCNYLLGSKCGVSTSPKINDGDYICKNLACVDEKGKERQNGESWCVYDSYIGEGKDTAGSRHWKRLCVDGVVTVEPCSDYRGQLCVESQTDVGGSKKISAAACVINRALECVNANGKDAKTTEKNCKDNPQCQLTQVNVDKGFKFSVCTAKYPAGFDLGGNNTRATSSAKELCKMASQKCTVIYEKKFSGWTCIANCACETKKFSQEMNNLCIGMGDCGSYINYVGDGTNNIAVKGAPKVSWQDYKKYATPVAGQKAEPDSLNYTLKRLGLGGNTGTASGSGNSGVGMMTYLQGAQGALGAAMMYFAPAHGAQIGWSYTAAQAASGAGGTPIFAPSTMASFGAGLIGGAIGGLVAGWMAKSMGLTGQGAMIFTMAGAVAGGMIAVYLVSGWSGWATTCIIPVVCLVILIIAIIIMIIIAILGIGKTKKVIVKFECLPWQAPTGGTNCDKCNSDPLKPCSEYRCASLGTACKLINADSREPVCVSETNDGAAPIITAGNTSSGFKFFEENTLGVKVRTTNNKCISAFTSVRFTLDTNERAQCKYDFVSADFDSLSEYPVESSYYTEEHTFGFNAPSLEALASEYNVTITGDMKNKYANMKMYVRCSDSYGNKNTKDYVVDLCVSAGADTTVPVVVATNPINGAYLRKNTPNINVTAYISEPAECKYDSVSSKTFAEMNRTMDCNTDLADAENSGWPCTTIWTGLSNSDNTMYIKCKDQPWLPIENDSLRNIGESYKYTLHGTQNDLRITNTKPTGTIYTGLPVSSINVEVETSGGIDNGNAICKYSFVDNETMTDQLLETGSTVHKQQFNLISGDYNIYLQCKDDSENIAYGIVNFSLKTDTFAPIVTRILPDAGKIKIMTNENARCSYDLKTCNFEIENATLMTIGYDTSHYINKESGQTYFVKCEDIYGNKAGDCNIRVRASDIV